MNSLLKNVLNNPIGIGLAILHWAIFLFALMFIQVDGFDKVRPSAEVAFFTLFILLILDIAAIFPVALLLLPFYWLGTAYFPLLILISFFTITFQWLLVGRKIYKVFWLKDYKILNLDINEQDKI